MGIVVPIKPILVGSPLLRGKFWYLHIGTTNKLPKGHPPVERGPRGKVLLAVNQVWVENHTDMLWVLRSFEVARKHPSYPHDVELTPYYNGTSQHIVAEMTLRQNMMVWEDAIQFRVGLGEKLDHASRRDPQSPFKGPNAAPSARKFFGLDKNGNRTEK